MTIVSNRVQHGRDNNCTLLFDYFVHHPIGEPVGVTPADVLARMPTALEQWVFLQRIKHLDDLLAELRTQAGVLRFIPNGGLHYIGLDLRMKQHPPLHAPYWLRSRCFI